jgi:hypothetical protein
MAGLVIKDRNTGEKYNQEAVEHAIRSHNRHSRQRISKREAALIHALLKGRG